MRAEADLTVTALRLERAAEEGPAPARTAARLEALKLLGGDVAARVEAALPGLADGGPGVAAEAARHLLSAGGKRVRPLLVVLAARALGDPAPDPLTRLAQAAELVHAATLLHDDVLDDGRVRRGIPAARVLWGNAASVLGGDFLLVRALELTAAAAIPRALEELLQAIAQMIDGEALQLAHRGRADLLPDGYRAVVDGKTASLFAWCGRAGARLAGAADPVVEAFGAYGLHLGRAFQIVDDVLDVEGDPRALGKCVLTDLREGKLTLPVLYALEAEPALRARLAGATDAEAIAGEIAAAVHRTAAARRARADARGETERALAAL
ncbi:MAG TPA: polyprenyl synthetase family protein, partial [Kofleriaceae bacterium]|nr:polyprenyl synthetase family protein [Kofleriaceae bacterium]